MNLENQQLLFRLFHDGTIFDISKSGSDYSFPIDILYLAERIDPNFSFFNLKLTQTQEFFFEYDALNEVVEDHNEINRLELEILKTNSTGSKIKVFCTDGPNDIFGFLHIQAKDIQIYDQRNHRLELVEVEQAARGYWKEFGERGGNGGE